MTITGSVSNREGDEFRFEQQCYLMHVMTYSGNDNTGLATADEQTGLAAINAKCKYTSFIPINGDPTTMMSILTGRNDLGFLTSMTPFQMSFLVPKIKLYKTHYEAYPSDNAGKAFDVEFVFPDNISGQVNKSNYLNVGGQTPRLERMLKDRAGRGMGVGLKEFSWTYEGTNPHEAANLLSARVSMHFNDINELFEKRGPVTCYYNGYEKTEANRVHGPIPHTGPYFRYVDLIMRTSETVAQIQEVAAEAALADCANLWLYNPMHFEVKAVVGYAVKEGAPFTESQIESIKSASIGLYMTLVDHVIDYNEDGSVGLDITYRAAVDGLMDDKNADLFLTMWERIRLMALESSITELQTANRRSPTAGGGTQAPVGSVANPPTQTATTDPGIADSSYEEQVQGYRDAITEIQSVTRAVTINSLSDWVADVGAAGSSGDIIVFGGGTAGGFRKHQKEARSYGEYDSATGQTLYPLHYGCPHGKSSDNSEPGLPRIKWVGVMPGDSNSLWSKTDGIPSFFVGSAASPAQTTAVALGSGEGTTPGTGPGGTAQATATSGLNDDTQGVLESLADPATEPNATSVANLHENLEDMVDDTRTYSGESMFTIPYVFYGDILDWAIRKALKRVPFDPDGTSAIDSLAKAVTEGAVAQSIEDFTESLHSGDDDEGVTGLTLTSGHPAEPGETFKSVEEFLEELRTVKSRMDKLTIIVGSMSYWDPVRKQYEQINLADIPVALDVLNNWIVNRLLRPGVTSYTLKDFIRDSLENLVLDILSGYGCYENEAKQMFDIGMVNFTMPGVWDQTANKFINPATLLQNNNPTATEICTGTEPGERSSLYKSGTYRVDLEKVQTELTAKRELITASDFEHENTDMYDFVAIYCRTYEIGTLLGFETKEEADAMKSVLGAPYDSYGELPGDLERGIYHLHLGQNQGLVKGITFSRTDQPFLAESRIFAHGHFGYNQLRGRYDATVRLQGNCLFLPGQLVYINPTTVGSGNIDYGDYTGKKAPLLLGLGGYYVVLDVQNTISATSFETTLRCIWHSSGLPEQCRPNEAEPDDGGSV